MAHRSTSSFEEEDEEQNMERHIHYNKRGELQMVGEKSLFDLNEPVWHADEKVRAEDTIQCCPTGPKLHYVDRLPYGRAAGCETDRWATFRISSHFNDNVMLVLSLNRVQYVISVKQHLPSHTEG